MPASALVDIDLFAGAGGLALGLKAAGFSPVHLYEKDDHACETLKHNAGRSGTLDAIIHPGKIEDVLWTEASGDVRLLAAGAPCQPFSLGGKHRAQEDGRNLFPEVLRAIRALRPQAVLIENVRGLLREEFQPFFEYILRWLEFPSLTLRKDESWKDHNRRIRRHQCSSNYAPEYIVTWRLLEAADFGVPQVRRRIFVVATRSDLPIYRFPLPSHSKQALLRAQCDGDYWERHGLKKRKPVTAIAKPESAADPWVTVRDGLLSLPAPVAEEAKAEMNHWLIPGARTYAGHGGSSLDWPSKTIKAGVHGVPGGENTIVLDNGSVRYYTLREAARIQTFPNQHLFKGARIHVTRQLGNAVPCRLAEQVAKPLFTILRQITPRGAVNVANRSGN
jgi:DNA (cytosine-5)-methyltransferase 1